MGADRRQPAGTAFPIDGKAPAGTPQREFIYTPADFARVQDLAYRLAGISLPPVKQELVYSRLARRLRALQLRSFGEYLDALGDGSGAELEHFVNALTTNLTAFFREEYHFDALRGYLQRSGAGQGTIWCAAASTGEEPYSIAITACEAFGTLAPPVRILASDIDTNVLQHGAAAAYDLERVAKLPAETLRRYFLRGSGSNEGKVRLRDEVRRLVTFRQINLLGDEWPIRGGFDAIFCRNVMIYFDRPTQRRVLERFAPLLKQDGLLFVGHSESLHHAADLFAHQGRTIYRRAS